MVALVPGQLVGGTLLHFVVLVCLVVPDDGQGVSLRVEDPVLEWQVVVLGEEQVEIPGGGEGEHKRRRYWSGSRLKVRFLIRINQRFIDALL